MHWYPPTVAPRSPRYLFVCTANINRSPIAAAWARRLLEDRFVVGEIRSAGTHAWEGAEAGAYAIDAMRELGFDLRSHRSQRLSKELLDWADQVVVMEPMHAEVACELLGPSGDRSKILQLWEDLPEQADHVWDPQGQALEVYRTSARVIGQSLEVLLVRLLSERRRQA